MAHHQISQHISHGIGSWLTATCGRIARQHKLLIATSSSENSKSTMVNSLSLYSTVALKGGLVKRYLYSMCKTCDLEDLYALKPRTEMDTEMPDGRCVQLATARLDESRVTSPAADRRLRVSNFAQGCLYTASTHARNPVLQIRVAPEHTQTR